MNKHFLDPLFNPRRAVLLVPPGEPPVDSRALLAGASIPCEVFVFHGDDPRFEPSAHADLAVICLPAESVGAALEECGRLRIRAAIVLGVDRPPAEHDRGRPVRPAPARQSATAASPASDEGAPDAPKETWREIAARCGIHLLGPQTLGLQRPHLNLNASQFGETAHAGNLALVAQSGALGAAIIDWASETSVGFSAVVSVGGDSGIDVAHVLDFLASDNRTQSILLYLEGISEARSFMSALRSAANAKPVLVLKAGIHPEGHRAALTHSGAIVGQDAVFNAALRRAGAVRVRFFTQLFAAARCLASRYRPCGPRLAIVTNGGGPGVLAADWAGDLGIRIAPTTPASIAALRDLLPQGSALANPIDLGERAGPEHYVAAMRVLAGDPGVDGIMLMCSPKLGIDSHAIAVAVAEAGKDVTKPLLACWMGGRTMRGPRELLDHSGIPAFRAPESAVDSFGNIVAYHQNQQLLQQTPPSVSGKRAPDIEGARIVIETVLAERRTALTEMESKSLLASFHIDVTRTILARTTTEALMVGAQLGYPVAMKISSPDILHKSEVGGVALNVRGAADVRTRFAEIIANAKAVRPDARIDGVTIQDMSTKTSGRELYIGVARDPLFGPVITFGAGGTMVEVIRDRSMELPPLNRFLARQLIERTRVARTLTALRGMPEVNFAALEDLLLSVSEMVCELPWLKEMDINPVIADEHGALAVDARILVEHAPPLGAGRHSHMAILPYPSHLQEEVPLSDGGSYTIRPIRPEDAEHIQDMMRGLSAETRYFRFFSTATEHSPRALARYTQVDYFREMALVAVHVESKDGTDNERIVGVARYLLNPGGDSAEFAVVVADDWAGRGLGARLMNSICEVARSKGIRRIEGFILGKNSNMLALMERLGFSIKPDPDDPELRIAEKTL